MPARYKLFGNGGDRVGDVGFEPPGAVVDARRVDIHLQRGQQLWQVADRPTAHADIGDGVRGLRDVQPIYRHCNFSDRNLLDAFLLPGLCASSVVTDMTHRQGGGEPASIAAPFPRPRRPSARAAQPTCRAALPAC